MRDMVDTSDAFRYHWLVWRLCGFQLPPRGSRWRIPCIVLAVVLVLNAMVLTPASWIINCCLSRSIRDFFESVYLSITMVNSSLKFANVYMTRHELEKVGPILEDLDSRVVKSKERTALRKGIKSVHRCFFTFITLFVLTILCNQVTMVFSNERTLMYPAWFPWDWQGSFGAYLWTLFYQGCCFYVHAVLAVCSDTYPQAYLCILAAQIKALAIRIEALGAKSQDSDYPTPEEQQREYEALVECIKDHATIDSLFSTLQKPISRTGLIQFACTGVAQCTIGIYILYVGLDYSRLAGGTTFLGAVTLQTLVLCYAGEMLCQEYLNLEKAIYACNWVDQNKPFRKAILLFLHRTQKTNCIVAGNLVPVRLPTFVKIVQMAYSGFTVLNELRSRVERRTLKSGQYNIPMAPSSCEEASHCTDPQKSLC